MYYLWNNGPITRRSNENTWPAFKPIYESKDDENFVYKTYVFTRYATVATAGFSIIDITMFPRPDPPLINALTRIKFWAVPLIGGAVTYTSAVQVTANIRGKNDQWNHFFGGAATGAVIGKCARCYMTGSLTALFLGFCAFMVKDCAMYNNFPRHKPHKMFGGAFHHKFDFTMVPDRQAYWVRTPEEIPKLMERGQV